MAEDDPLLTKDYSIIRGLPASLESISNARNTSTPHVVLTVDPLLKLCMVYLLNFFLK
jgi:hypothetical protein